MKLIHLSDLHLGKRVNDFPMLEDQAYILDRVLEIAGEEQPDAVLIAGDVYDKTVPSAEAVALLDDFLVKLADRSLPVLLISGNHDSPERLAFANRLMEGRGVYIAPVYHGEVSPVTLEDDRGPVDFWLLPFLKPAHIRRFFPEEGVESFTDAMACAIRHMPLDPARRNVLVTHQFVTGAARCESEEVSVGGADNVDASVFAPFDYVALGHLHGPQNVGGERIRYCGTPLKYSFSEAGHQKSVTIVELGEKGSLEVRAVPLLPQRDMVELRGSFAQLKSPEFYGQVDRDAYVRVILTDENDIYDAMGQLRPVYPNLMALDYDNLRTRSGAVVLEEADVKRDPLELFADFYQQQNHQPMSEEQRRYLTELLEMIQEERA
ncbi:MAG: exonuclease SbcCD subunit D [Oscillospiraceae bacterium]|nr:exonuclease SbcCD subunit D [Oscillospiraceae bacterium]